MIAEDLNSEQILQRINNRIDIYKEWNYKLNDKLKVNKPIEVSPPPSLSEVKVCIVISEVLFGSVV